MLKKKRKINKYIIFQTRHFRISYSGAVLSSYESWGFGAAKKYFKSTTKNKKECPVAPQFVFIKLSSEIETHTMLFIIQGKDKELI